MGEHVKKEEELAVRDTGQAGGEATAGSAFVFRGHGFLVALPVLAIGRIGDEVVEVHRGMTIVGEGGAEAYVVGVLARGVFHEEVGLGHRPGFGIDLLAVKVDFGLRVDRRSNDRPILAPAERDVLLGDHEHAARTTAGVVDCADYSLAFDFLLVAREHEVDHEVDDVSGRKVLAGVLVHRLVELAQELLEDSAHRRVVDQLGMEIDVLEALHDLEDESRLVELADSVGEIEFLDDLAHIGAEAGDVVAEIGGKVGGVARHPLEIVARGVVEGEARSLAQLGVEVLETLAAEFGLALEDLFLGGARTQSRRRSTVKGRMMSWYLPRLKVSRMRSATPQMKLTISLWFIIL